MAKQIEIPEFSLILLIGPSGSGKSSFAKKHFGAAEVISSDYCRFLVSNDENSQDATTAAFEVLRFIAAKSLRRAQQGTHGSEYFFRRTETPVHRFAEHALRLLEYLFIFPGVL